MVTDEEDANNFAEATTTAADDSDSKGVETKEESTPNVDDEVSFSLEVFGIWIRSSSISL